MAGARSGREFYDSSISAAQRTPRARRPDTYITPSESWKATTLPLRLCGCRVWVHWPLASSSFASASPGLAPSGWRE